MAACDQVSLADALVSERVGRNAVLRRASRLTGRPSRGWCARSNPARNRQPPLAPLLLFKALLLQSLYGLSDRDLEEALGDRLSFRRFVGLGLEEAFPTTRCCRASAIFWLPRACWRSCSGNWTGSWKRPALILKRGTMLDATLIEAISAPPSGRCGPRRTRRPLRRRQGQGRLTFGYKAHVGVDEGSGLIRTVITTPANVNDTVPADALIAATSGRSMATRPMPSGRDVRRCGRSASRPRIMHKSWGGGPPLSFGEAAQLADREAAGRGGAGLCQPQALVRAGAGALCGLVRNAAHLRLGGAGLHHEARLASDRRPGAVRLSAGAAPSGHGGRAAARPGRTDANARGAQPFGPPNAGGQIRNDLLEGRRTSPGRGESREARSYLRSAGCASRITARSCAASTLPLQGRVARASRPACPRSGSAARGAGVGARGARRLGGLGAHELVADRLAGHLHRGRRSRS